MNPVDEMVARLDSIALMKFESNKAWGRKGKEWAIEAEPEYKAAALIRSLAAERDELAFELKRRPTFDTRPTHTKIAEANYKAKDANRRATAAEAEIAVLRKALKPFGRLYEIPEMGLIERECDVTLAGEGGQVVPPFDLIAALRRARAALKEQP